VLESGRDSGEGSEETAVGAKKVLVIDDSRDILDLMKIYLEKLGAIPILAQDGKEGVEAARTQKPHLILLDVVMPGMSGEEVADMLAIEPETTNIPLVFFTSLADGKGLDDARVEQRRILPKGMPSKQLMEKLSELLSDE
jgi:CheY-like chemotaxis protein